MKIKSSFYFKIKFMNQNVNKLTPFACTYSANVPELLYNLGCTIAISTYQAGKLVFISAKDENKIVQLPRTFEKPMGIAYDRDKQKMGLACKTSIEFFQNSKELAEFYPKGPKKYDALFMPRLSYNTGGVDIHDLKFGGDTFYGINTLFSCINTFDNQYSFTPYWKPSFITEIKPQDRCHLNGMVIQNGKPKYVTAFNQGNTPQSWRDNITETGVLIDVDNNNIVTSGLGMPHSPEMINDSLYVLLSATGKLIKINPSDGSQEEVIDLKGFVRGMGYYKDYLFIGLSKLRKNSSTFAKLDIAKHANEAGIAIVHLPTGTLQGKITYHNSVDEIYDIEILPNLTRPNILNPASEESKMGLSIPNQTFWSAKKED